MTEEEKQRRRYIRKEFKKKNFALFYEEFGVIHRLWLKELTEKYKERGIYPISPHILSDYYKDYNDKLIATLTACFLLDDNNRVMQQVMAIKAILGDHPYEELYLNRGFVLLSKGSLQNKNISYYGSVRYWKISNLFNILWDIEHRYNKELFDVFLYYINVKKYTPYHALLFLFEELPVTSPEWRINFALLRLCGTGGISEHIWNIRSMESKLECPLNNAIRTFVNNWIPNWRNMYSLSDVCNILGFEKNIDLYYCYLAFKELSLYKEDEIRGYLRTYSIQLKNRTIGKNGRQWIKKRLPNIEFPEANN